MRAKVLLSLALAHQPQLLILDEPTSGLDTLVRREFLESIVDIAAAGRTVLLSNHLISEVERVADIVAIMREGRLLVVESLDTFKCQTRELTITLAAGAAAPPEIPGQVLASRRRSRQWQVLVRDVSEADVDALRNNEATVAVEARTPGLEEIFVAYMQSEKQLDRVSGGGHATATATAPSPEQCNERRHQHNQPANSCQLRGQRQTHLPPLLAWKEYRILRGFWFAVAGLCVIEQLVSAELMLDARVLPGWLFASAWGAAALYAVGAAITLFSAEREERTSQFLKQLPGRWHAVVLEH